MKRSYFLYLFFTAIFSFTLFQNQFAMRKSPLNIVEHRSCSPVDSTYKGLKETLPELLKRHPELFNNVFDQYLREGQYKHFWEQVDEASEYITKKIGERKPILGIVLTCAVKFPVNLLNDVVKISFEDIPNMPKTTVVGHSGSVVFGEFCGKCIVVIEGRKHLYEGIQPYMVPFLYHVLGKCGLQYLISTTMVGLVKVGGKAGDIVIVDSLLSNPALNVLSGVATYGPFESPFVDTTGVLDEGMRNVMFNVARENNIKIEKGKITCVPGPYFETCEDLEFYRKQRVAVIGMTTDPEIQVCGFWNIRLLPIACSSNLSRDQRSEDLDHNEHMDVMQTIVAPKLNPILPKIVEKILVKHQED